MYSPVQLYLLLNVEVRTVDRGQRWMMQGIIYWNHNSIMNISNRLILSLSLFAASAIGGCLSSASFIVPCRTSLLSRTPNNITTRLFGRRGGGGKKKDTTTQKFTKSNLPEKICVVCGRPFAWRKKWERCWDEVTCCSKSCNALRRSASKEA